jgi:ArsR family transcriptional regulator
MDALQSTVRLAKALAHPTRLRIVALLRQGPLPVCQITSVLQSLASTVSKHLNDLRPSGVVTAHRQGKFVYYGLSDTPSAVAVLNAILRPLADNAQIRQDAALGESIRAMSSLIVCEGSPSWPDERVDRGRTRRPGGPRS